MEIPYGFTQEELDEYRDMDCFIREHVDWDLVPMLIKKRIAARRMAYAAKTQGSIVFKNGFSFDSDYTDKLYHF